MSNDLKALQKAVEKLHIGEFVRHVFVCLGDDCCKSKVGEETWDTLKKEIKDRDLKDGPNAVFRTKVGCLRVCANGPILVVYPEGTWYHSMTADRIPHFVQKHLIEGQPVEEWIFARNPLPNTQLQQVGGENRNEVIGSDGE